MWLLRNFKLYMWLALFFDSTALEHNQDITTIHTVSYLKIKDKTE